ncbi:MAG TPA: C39 family peptidase [Chloroflexota bacterium]|nr:C39 family peptidase [Chloroflexota bacterium]
MKKSLAAGLLSAFLALSAWLPAYAALDAADPAQAALALSPAPPSATVGPMLFISQTLNNCGPSSVAEVLDYWGIHKSQGEVQAVLRADGNQFGMAPFGMPAYARSVGLSAWMGAGGSDQLIKALVSKGFPVIVSQWVSVYDHYGHYRPIGAYDDARGVFISSDPYLGPNLAISYDEFDKIWASSNNRFYVIYPPAREPLLRSVLASVAYEPTSAYQSDIAIQQARLNGGQINGPQGWGFRRGYSALSMAWDNLQLGDIAAAQRALDWARVQGTSAIVTGWIADEIKLRQGSAGAVAT